ncbi:MAG TPA: hypothetical protein VEU33_00800, partial [Archangium sp.]|nr:hypothetical protein [Archangium sp.]
DRGYLFVTVAVSFKTRPVRPWRLGRARVEAGCRKDGMGANVSLPVVITSAISMMGVQRHTLATRLPEGAGCLSLTLEEDGPRTLHLQDWRFPP